MTTLIQPHTKSVKAKPIPSVHAASRPGKVGKVDKLVGIKRPAKKATQATSHTNDDPIGNFNFVGIAG